MSHSKILLCLWFDSLLLYFSGSSSLKVFFGAQHVFLIIHLFTYLFVFDTLLIILLISNCVYLIHGSICNFMNLVGDYFDFFSMRSMLLSSHLFWTSDLCTHQPGVTQDFSIFLLRCLPLFLSREGFGCPFPSSTVTSNFVFPFPSSCDCTVIQTRIPTSEDFEVTN